MLAKFGKKKKRQTIEKDIQKSILEYLSKVNCYFWRSNNIPAFSKNFDGTMRFRALPKYTPRGLPDIFIIYRGYPIALEVKKPGAYQKPDQKKFEENYKKHGGEYYVVYSLEDAQNIMRDITNRDIKSKII
jgi:hypothetical protein